MKEYGLVWGGSSMFFVGKVGVWKLYVIVVKIHGLDQTKIQQKPKRKINETTKQQNQPKRGRYKLATTLRVSLFERTDQYIQG